MIVLQVMALCVSMILIGIPLWWGILDMYGCYRWARKKEIDFTAAILHWWQVKSLFATQSEAMVKLFPWLAMDLSEERGVTKDDGEVT